MSVVIKMNTKTGFDTGAVQISTDMDKNACRGRTARHKYERRIPKDLYIVNVANSIAIPADSMNLKAFVSIKLVCDSIAKEIIVDNAAPASADNKNPVVALSLTGQEVVFLPPFLGVG
jgi:hypothetical protein